MKYTRRNFLILTGLLASLGAASAQLLELLSNQANGLNEPSLDKLPLDWLKNASETFKKNFPENKDTTSAQEILDEIEKGEIGAIRSRIALEHSRGQWFRVDDWYFSETEGAIFLALCQIHKSQDEIA